MKKMHLRSCVPCTHSHDTDTVKPKVSGCLPCSSPNQAESWFSSPTLNFSTFGLIQIYENSSTVIRNL